MSTEKTPCKYATKNEARKRVFWFYYDNLRDELCRRIPVVSQSTNLTWLQSYIYVKCDNTIAVASVLAAKKPKPNQNQKKNQMKTLLYSLIKR